MSTQAIQSDIPRPRVPQSARVRARLRGWSLDAELASGADPGSRPELAARARWLCRARHRRQLATGLEHIVREAERPASPLTASPPVHRPTIRAARADLLAIAAELRQPGSLAPRGIALVRRLLVDDVGPLHAGGMERLQPALAEIRAAMDQGPTDSASPDV